jgi:hypothetical protein
VIIQSLWLNPELSTIAKLSMASFLRHGCQYHLYVYDEVRGVPSGVTVKDANEILPQSAAVQPYARFSDRVRSHLIRLRKKGGWWMDADIKHRAHFSDHFRYHLIRKNGGWWMDADIVCLKPLAADSEIVLSGERRASDSLYINNAVLLFPKDSPAMKYACEQCDGMDLDNVFWGTPGPVLMTDIMRRFALEQYRKPPQVFNPVPWWDYDKFIEPNAIPPFSEDTLAVHMWHSRWRGAQDPELAFPPDCLYEQLKRMYL